MIRIGVVGAGRHSVATHGPALKILRQRQPHAIELSAICDLDEGRSCTYAKNFGFRRTYTDLALMLEEERLDALLAITPLPLTEKIVAELLPAGIPLLIEKPPGTTPQAARRLLALARECRTPHMISFNRRFNPAVLQAQAWLAEDPAGRRPRTVLGRMLRHARHEPDFAIGTGIHLIDAVLSFTGAPRHVSSDRHSTGRPERHFFSATLRYPERSAHILIAPACGIREETIEIHGDDYTLKIDTFANRLQVFQNNQFVSDWRPTSADPPELLDVINETEAFLQAVSSGTGMNPTLEEGVVSMLTAEAIQTGGETRVHPAL